MPMRGDGLVPKWVNWVCGLFLVVPLMVFGWVNVMIDDRDLDPEERAEIAALEDSLRPRGAVEDALTRYEAVMQQIAGELSQTQPGLTWRWDRRARSRFEGRRQLRQWLPNVGWCRRCHRLGSARGSAFHRRDAVSAEARRPFC